MKNRFLVKPFAVKAYLKSRSCIHLDQAPNPSIPCPPKKSNIFSRFFSLERAELLVIYKSGTGREHSGSAKHVWKHAR
jgi:hypothetical protein